MGEVTLIEILEAREKRVSRQRELLEKYSRPLICFTMNIAGPIKVTPLIERAFFEGLGFLENKLSHEKVLLSEDAALPTGCEAFLSVDMDAKELKKICIEIEEATPLGRLFDMDVLDTDGRKLDREIERSCIVCGKKGRSCSAGRLHSVEELQEVTRRIMHAHFEEADRKKISSIAVQSLIEEVKTTPKPGLVDIRNSGSHTDMDIDTFIKSANALAPYFYNCIRIGQETKALSSAEVFSRLREEGIRAEKTMYDVTGGVNTHKGAIYSFGIICGAVGRLWTSGNPIARTDEIFSECAKLVFGSIREDFENIDSSTAGGRLYLECGMRGIRGEVADGFPSVSEISLPIYEKAIGDGLSQNDAGVLSLLHMIANVDDTTLYNRGGIAGMEFAKISVRELLEKSPFPDKKEVEELDDRFIEKNLSPGGCADLLAVTYFLHKIKSGVI